MNFPFIKFYVRDWMGDSQLRMCSLAARGLWFEMICLMHGAKRYGYLEAQTGKPLTDDELSRLTGTFKGDLYTLKQELLDHGVPSVEESTSIWYCRRMVKEEQKREKCSIAGRSGGGNPALHHHPNTDTSKEATETRDQKPETRDHISLKATFKGHPKGASSADDGYVVSKAAKKKASSEEYSEEFERFWKAYPRKVGKITAYQAWKKTKNKPSVDDIIEKVQAFKDSTQWSKNGGEYIPHPSSWINRGGWDDEVQIEANEIRWVMPTEEELNKPF